MSAVNASVLLHVIKYYLHILSWCSSNRSKYSHLWHLTWSYASWCLWNFSVIFCEAVAIYGVIVAIILQTKLEAVPKASIYAPESMRAGYAIFASGIIVGFANLVCGCVLFFTCVSYLHSNYPGDWRESLFVPVVHIQLFLLLQVVCRNNWKQLRIVWCSKLNSLCENSCDWDLR